MASNSCPEDPELVAMLMGNAVPGPVRRHVDDCGACRLRMDRLRAELSAVRQAADELPARPDAVAALVAAIAETTSAPTATESTEDGFEVTEPADPRPRPESIGRYRIIGELDSGGQASVYRAVHPTLPRDLAIKIAHEPSEIDSSLLRGDAQILCELDHPNLVRVHDLDIHEGRPFVVMEFVRGRNLHQAAEQLPLSPDQAAAWVAEIARALAYVHGRGIVHQDVKPKNIMLDESGRPRLIDFGMARWRHAWSGNRSGPSGGTLAFMAPEQARGEAKRVGASSDIFGLGGVLYFLLTGKTPFGGGTRNEQWRRASHCDFDRDAMRAKGVPRRLERIVLKAMATEPGDRYASADRMADALDEFARRPRRLALGAAALLLAALTVMVWSWWPRPVSRPDRNVAGGPAPHQEATPNIPAGPDVRPEMTPAPQILSLQVVLHRVSPDDPVGVIGFDAMAGRLGQNARVRVELKGPAYCFLIALNPDGSTQLCHPESPTIVPRATSAIDYPNDPKIGFGLTDGVGTQVFAVVASSRRLPSYAEWSRAVGGLSRKSAPVDTVWEFDGRRFDRHIVRGEPRPLADLPQPLDSACRALRAGPGIEAIRAVAFAVQQRPETKRQQGPHSTGGSP
jgi:predicted Ser/Thr protein kinase